MALSPKISQLRFSPVRQFSLQRARKNGSESNPQNLVETYEPNELGFTSGNEPVVFPRLQEKPEPKPVPKKPSSPFMEEMVERIQSSSNQEQRLMVGPGGTLAFDSIEPMEEQISKEVTAKAGLERGLQSLGGTSILTAMQSLFSPLTSALMFTTGATLSMLRAGGN